MVLKALKEGSTLVIDEFDVSLHPMAIMNMKRKTSKQYYIIVEGETGIL